MISVLYFPRRHPSHYLFAEFVCDSSPCNNNGTCIPTGPTNFTCGCDIGYSGLQCNGKINKVHVLK